LAKICLFVWFREGLGDHRYTIDIVHAGTAASVARPWEFRQRFEDPTHSVFARFLLTDVRFDEPGTYTVDFYVDDELLDFQMFHVLDGAT
jgi:hypothetical protein